MLFLPGICLAGVPRPKPRAIVGEDPHVSVLGEEVFSLRLTRPVSPEEEQ